MSDRPAPRDPIVVDLRRPRAAGAATSFDRLARYLERLADERFYGKVTVTFQNGRACDVRVEQTHKLDEL